MSFLFSLQTKSPKSSSSQVIGAFSDIGRGFAGLFFGMRAVDCIPGTYCGWTKSISHHFETMVETIFVGIFKGIIVLGFLRWCRICPPTVWLDFLEEPLSGLVSKGD